MPVLRNPSTLHEREVPDEAVPFFVNQGYVVLDAAGRVKAQQSTTTASDNKKES